MFPRFKRSIKHRRPDLAARQQQAAGKQNRAAFIKPYLRPEEGGVTKRISKAECRGSARLKLNPAIDPVRELVPVVFMSEGGEKTLMETLRPGIKSFGDRKLPAA